ncbi:MAG: RNA polymerase sigma factor [Polyangiales bacterium]
MHVVSSKPRANGGPSDLALMKLVAGGDTHAQRVLAHRLAPRVQRLVRRLLSNSVEADDAAQVALMEILRSAVTYRDEASIERWADRIAVRTALRHAREQRKRFFTGGPVEADELHAHEEVDDTREETPRRLEEYLAQLPVARREVLVMKHALGYTTEEIAELIDKPVGTVKDRLVAARKQIRRVILREMRVGVGERKHG